jgi:hypothetical protein
MTDEARLVDALLIAGSIALFFGGVFYVAYRVVTWARRGSKKAYVIGAALAPLMFNVVDPDFRIVNEAKQLKKREEDNPGDPPDGEGERAAPREVQVADELEYGGLEAEVAMTTKPRVWHPVFARAIALVLSLMALATTVVASMALLSDFYGSDVRQSFSPFEWASIYLMSALLLVSMFQLFRLKKASVWLFAGYLGLGILTAIGQSLMQEPGPHLDLRVTFVTVPLALAVLAYMRRLSTQGKLV